ncbi:MAG: hypothetical protein R3F13_14120 [Prosthecobacter sp.]
MIPDSNKIEASLLQMLSGVLKTDDGQRIELAECLHKNLAGGLVAGVSLTEMVRHSLENERATDRVRNMLASLDSTLRQALQLVRDLTERQFPPVLKAFGLTAALQQLARQIGETFAGSLVLNVIGEEPRFDMVSRLNLFRLMEALLKFCVRHAGTSWVEVTCRACPEKLDVTLVHEGNAAIWAGGTRPELAEIQARCILLGSRMQVSHGGADGISRVSLLATPSQPT